MILNKDLLNSNIFIQYTYGGINIWDKTPVFTVKLAQELHAFQNRRRAYCNYSTWNFKLIVMNLPVI